jgi:hypothetical protein
MNDLADPTDHPLSVAQAQHRVLTCMWISTRSAMISKPSRAEIALRPTRGEILKLALGCFAAVVVALLLLR